MIEDCCYNDFDKASGARLLLRHQLSLFSGLDWEIGFRESCTHHFGRQNTGM